MLRDKLFIFLLLFVCVVCVECKTCRSMDIRNKAKELTKLRNCTEIWGYLRILLIEWDPEPEFDKYVFPELTKITGYLFFFNVGNLTSIGKLFPNLVVIRGYELFSDYALVIYNMPHLREIGTPMLMYIARGFVKIDKCDNLCFVDTIDWAAIGTDITFNNNNNGTCDVCARSCEGHCWNAERCQMRDTGDCHQECLGCHKPNSEKHCWVCKNFNDHGTCVAECPSKRYKQASSFKCVTEFECINTIGKWWVYKSDCVNECPPEFKAATENGRTTCIPCSSIDDDECIRWCNPPYPLDSLSKLQSVKSCTHINGSLTIRMAEARRDREEVFISELRRYLYSVKYIKDSLVIARTNSLQSLDFLANLKIIDGENLENDRFAIFVYENKNLQKLWNFDNFTLTLNRGLIGFFSNPLLCQNEIKTLANLTGLPTNFSNVEVYGNGDRSSCNSINLTFNVITGISNATITWDLPKLNNDSYIGFTIYYTDNPKENISTFESQNVCDGRGWKSHLTTENSIFLTNLDPYTRYAYYIKIYQSSMMGPQTTVNYFTTLSSEPLEPAQLDIKVVDDHTLQVIWKPPFRSNGILSHYQLYVVMEPDTDIQNQRDYCLYPRTAEGEKVDTFDADQGEEDREMMNRNRLSEKCTCKNKGNEVTQEEISIMAHNMHLPLCDLQSLSKFGFDNCRHLLYKSFSPELIKVEASRQKRSTTDSISTSSTTSRIIENSETSFLLNVTANSTEYTFKSLRHFTMYVFYLSACNVNGKCGEVQQNFARTKKLLKADIIDFVDTTVENSNVFVEWSEPTDPNGVILSYNIEYRKVDVVHSQRQVECQSTKNRLVANKLTLTNLPTGEFGVRVQAVSLAGPGPFSKIVNFFIVAPTRSSDWVVPLISTLLVIALLAFIFYMQYRRKQKLRNIPLIATINPDYDGIVYVEDEWEVDRKDVEIQGELGHGTFGMVYCGLIKSKNIACAIKTVNDTLSLHECMEFLNEASIMKAFSNSHHVVKLLGVVSKGQPPLVIMELMERGDLKKYLRGTRDSSQNITANEIYRMSIEIADGMAYLSAKKFVHRDLAARNCMVANDRTVKIGDFGMARDIYETDYYRKETKGLLPVRWMAPESLADGVFTSDSDVWSYGIVLWEIATLAEQPYQGLSNEQVLQFVVSKGKLERPAECPDLLYEIMDACWCWRPNDRPTFIDIVERLEDHVGQDFKLVSFIHSREGLEHKMNHGRERSYNPPALGMGAEEHDLYGGHFNVSDEEVSLYVGDSSNRPRFLPASISQRLNRFSPSDVY